MYDDNKTTNYIEIDTTIRFLLICVEGIFKSNIKFS